MLINDTEIQNHKIFCIVTELSLDQFKENRNTTSISINITIRYFL